PREPGMDEAAPADAEEQPRRRHEVSVEDLDQRKQRREEDDPRHGSGGERALEGGLGPEVVRDELAPRKDERDREDDRAVEEDPADEREGDDALEPLGIKAFARLLGLLADRLEAGHEVGDDLQDEQDREDRAARSRPGEERGEPARIAAQEPRSREGREQ